MFPFACDVSLCLRRVSRDDWGGVTTGAVMDRKESAVLLIALVGAANPA